MPHQRGGCERDLPAARLEPPADVDVVSGAHVHRIEPVDRQERVLPARRMDEFRAWFVRAFSDAKSR
jgi:hypothetical protein